MIIFDKIFDKIHIIFASKFSQNYENDTRFLHRSAYSAAGKYVIRSWEYINRSQTHECGNWD
jgi:hypothetical protein